MWRPSSKTAGARKAARLLKPEWSRTSIRLSGSTCVYPAISAEKRSVVTSWLDVVTAAKKKKLLHVSPPTEPFLLGRNDSNSGLRTCLYNPTIGQKYSYKNVTCRSAAKCKIVNVKRLNRLLTDYKINKRSFGTFYNMWNHFNKKYCLYRLLDIRLLFFKGFSEKLWYFQSNTYEPRVDIIYSNVSGSRQSSHISIFPL